MLTDSSLNLLINAAAILFAVIFFGVGCYRVVEFKAAGVPPAQRIFLIPLHILGCAAFASAFALFALDPLGKQKMWMQALFAGAVLILFPVHIYVGLKRRIRLSE